MGKIASIASKEIRLAALKARAEGATVATISQVLGKSMRTLFRWFKDYNETGKEAPAKRGHPKRVLDDSQLQRIEALLASSPDLTAEEIKERLELPCHIDTIYKAIRRSGWRYKKKTLSAQEQEREEVKLNRERWRLLQAELPPQRLVFIDESAITTHMTRLYGRAKFGARCLDKVPRVRRGFTSLLGAIRSEGRSACMVIKSLSKLMI